MTSALAKKHDFDLVYDSQGVFRLLLEGMSNPFRRLSIAPYIKKLFGQYPELLALGMTLLDNEVSFAVLGDERLGEELKSLTLSREQSLTEADFIFVCDTAYLEECIKTAKCGTLEDPQLGATIIVRDDTDPSESLHVYGPGINGLKEVAVSPAVKRALALREEQFYEYPQGIDLIFISTDGQFLSVPRLALTEVK